MLYSTFITSLSLVAMAVANPISSRSGWGTCTAPIGAGICGEVSACAGTAVPNHCPGPTNIQCCVPTSGSGHGHGHGHAKGQRLLKAASTQLGLPYVWGGGGCDGPSDGGFDCSGLTQFTVCKVLGKTIPRTAQDQYSSLMGQHLPREQARPGDMLFWATGGDCANSVGHVGIFKSEGEMLNAAHTGTPVRQQSIWISSGGEEICPDVVRFW